jgi:hypothetical protein
VGGVGSAGLLRRAGTLTSWHHGEALKSAGSYAEDGAREGAAPVPFLAGRVSSAYASTCQRVRAAD